MKNVMEYCSSLQRGNALKFFLCMGVLLLTFSVMGQVNITGTVLDEDGVPLAGVSILEKGSQNGVVSDFDGKYSINVKTNAVLMYSYLGYKTLEKPTKGQSVVNVLMSPDFQQLDETVVIGYGSLQRKDLTGSVASVDMKGVKEAPVVNFVQALAGRVAGVQVSGGSGEPGSGLNIVIRGGNTVNGSNAPLFVIDGFVMPNFSSNLLDPADIQSIDILKDASATAIYGARGSNGVILITTKTPKIGKTSISFETRVDVNNVTKKMEVLNGYEFVRLSNEIHEERAADRFFKDSEGNIVGDVEDYQNVPWTNWQDIAFRSGLSRNHTLQVSHGNETTRINLSLNTLKNEGTLINTDFERVNGRLNLNHKLSPKLGINLNVLYSNRIYNGINTFGNSSYSFLRGLIQYTPVLSLFRDYGDFDPLEDIVGGDFDFSNIFNWHPILTLENEYRKREFDQIVTNLGVKYKVAPHLTFESRGSYNGTFGESGIFNNSKTVSGRLVSKVNGINGSINHSKSVFLSHINTLNYNKRFKKHRINALLGTDIIIRKGTTTSFRAVDIPEYLEGLGINALDSGTLNDDNDVHGSSESRLYSVFGRLNYSFRNKYLLTASIRRDGSSKFASNNRIGYFPSFAASWKAEQEKFIKNLGLFSQLKLRIGYGKTGNDRIPNNIVYDVLADTRYFFDGEEVIGQRPPSTGSNSNIKWETTETYNAGLDIGLFNNRISIAAEVYQKDTKNLLINKDASPSQGFTSIWENNGQVRNRGLELVLSTVNVSAKNFTWTSDFNISFNENQVISLPEGKPIFARPNYYRRYSSNQFIVEEGRPLGNIYGYISDGVYQPEDFVNYDPTSPVHPLLPTQPSYRAHEAGDEKYKDLNGDGNITADDKTIIGNTLPEHFGGITNTFTYKNFQLSAFFQWSYGNDILNANRLVFESTIFGQNNLATVLNRWTLDHQDTHIHRAGGRGLEDISSRVVEDGSYIRLKTINLSYSFSKDNIQKFGIKDLSLYAAAQNLITWTNYSGFDPDVSVINSPIMPGIDYSAYPLNRTMSLGLKISF